jgi:chromosome partitioning protein
LPPPRRIKETISDVATAHAELDNVLPPVVASGTAPPPVERQLDVEPDRVSDTPVAPLVEPVVAREPVLDVSGRVEHSGPSDAGPVEPVLEVASSGAGSVQAEPVAPPPVVAPVDDAPATESAGAPNGSVQAASGNPLPRVLAVANQKGGVGKTTTSVNLGAALAELGFRVLVIDLDPQGNATTGLGIDARNFELSMYDVLMRDSSLEDCVEPTSMKNLFVAPATIALAGAEIELVPAFSREMKLKKAIESIIDDFDYVLIDCPPSLGLITVNALAAADEVLVPIQCEYYALEGLSQLMRNVHLVASNLNPQLDISTIVLTMYDARTKLADQVANEVRLHFGSKVCRSVIPRTVRLSEAPSFGQPITAFDPASRGAIAYRELAKEVSGGTT